MSTWASWSPVIRSGVAVGVGVTEPVTTDSVGVGPGPTGVVVVAAVGRWAATGTVRLQAPTDTAPASTPAATNQRTARPPPAGGRGSDPAGGRIAGQARA